MAAVTIVCLLISTVVVLITFAQGMGVLRGSSVATHLGWALAALVTVLAANFIAIVHAAQSARLIRALRARLALPPER
jgi:hypothetical protein